MCSFSWSPARIGSRYERCRILSSLFILQNDNIKHVEMVSVAVCAQLAGTLGYTSIFVSLPPLFSIPKQIKQGLVYFRMRPCYSVAKTRKFVLMT